MSDSTRLAPVTVSAGILFQNGKILIGRRSYGLTTRDLWEFPGGKIEPGETPEQCLVRECREELGASVTVGREFDRACHAYPDRDVHLIFLLGEIEGEVTLHSMHTELKWVTPAALREYAFCPADTAVIEKIIKTFE